MFLENMLKSTLLFTLKKPDLIFAIILAAIIGVFILVYILTPIVKKKQFDEAKANLRKREETFRANLQRLNGGTANPDEEIQE